jgi:hypothetical protein
MRYDGAPYVSYGWSRVPGLLTNDGKTDYSIRQPPPPPDPGAPQPPKERPVRRQSIGFFTDRPKS